MNPLETLALAETEFGSRLENLTDTTWDNATPAGSWKVRDLVAHVIGGNVMAVRLLDGCTAYEARAAINDEKLDGDPFAQFQRSAAAQREAFSTSGALEMTVHHPVGDISGSQLLGFRYGDLVLHAWDLARGAGLDDTLNPVLVDEVWTMLQPISPFIGSVGVFGDGPSGLVASDAPMQLQLLDLTGRRP